MLFVHFMVNDYFNIPACLHIYFVLTNIAESFQSCFFRSLNQKRKRHRSNTFCVTLVLIERFFYTKSNPILIFFVCALHIFKEKCMPFRKKFTTRKKKKKFFLFQYRSEKYLRIFPFIIHNIHTLGKGGKG